MGSSWEKGSKWYHSIVGKEGHYFHKTIILPNVFKLLKSKKVTSLLDLGCGQGVLAHNLPPSIEYHGIDLSPSLIKLAKKRKKASFYVGDMEKKLPVKKTDFDAAACILSIQNVKHPQKVFANVNSHLKKNGLFIIIMNHPCFRIPRQSCWDIDQDKKMQSRKVSLYMSPLEIPISIHPGQKENSPSLYSYHHPLSTYSQWLEENHFAILRLEEWISDKTSTGKYAKMENRARKEFPMFLAIIAKKDSSIQN